MILKHIDEALERKGLSDAAASQMAVGHQALVKKLRLPAKGEKRYNYASLEKLAKVLDLEIYFGPPRDDKPETKIILGDDDYSKLDLYPAKLACGNGVFNRDEQKPIDSLAFSKQWLNKNNINKAKTILVTAEGQSMQPNIYDGDLVMIDQSKREIINNRIYAFVDGDHGAKIKRLELLKKQKTLWLHSDNPNKEEYATEPRSGADLNQINTVGMIGQVVWSGHKW